MADNLNRMEELKNRIRAQLTLKMEQPPKEQELNPGFHLEGYSNEEIGQALDELHTAEEIFGVCGAQVKVDSYRRIELEDSDLTYEERQNLLADLYRKNAIGGSTQPQLEFRFLFWIHSGAEDMAGLKDELVTSDVYAPEIGGFTNNSKLEAMLNSLSFGQITLEQALATSDYKFSKIPAWQHMLQCIASSKKPIIVAEEEIPSVPSFDDKDIYLQTRVAFSHGDLVEAIRQVRLGLKDHGQDVLRREDSFTKTLKLRLQSIFEFCPDLENKTPIKVLSGFGRVHSFTLPTLIRKEFSGSAFSSPFQPADIIFSTYEQLLAAVTTCTRNTESFSDLECARAILEMVILRVIGDTNANFRFALQAASALSLEQIDIVSQKIGKRLGLVPVLREFGIEVPIRLATTEKIGLGPPPLGLFKRK